MPVNTMEQTVTAVEPRKVNTKDKGEITVYDIADAVGVRWTAWDRQLAERAFALKDQPALWEVETKLGRNGNEYRNLRGIQAKPTEGFPAALSAMQAQVTNGPGETPSLPPKTREALTEAPSYRDRTIFRQTAAKAVATLASGTTMTADEFWGNVQDLSYYFETGEVPAYGEDKADISERPRFSDDPEQDSIPF